MKKWKKAYCMATMLLACAVLVFTIIFCIADDRNVYASSMEPNSITDLDNDSQTEDDTQQSARDDEVNGLSIMYNNSEGSVSAPIRMLLVLTILALAPSLLIMLTSFTRIIIVLHFVRMAIGTQSAPPNQVLVGLALFMTFFIMWPTFQEINENAIKPLDEGTITQEEAFEAAGVPLREFMCGETLEKDLILFVDLSGDTTEYETYEQVKEEVPMTTLIPAFILSELRTAFIIGFLMYMPFIVIDMVVSSVLMSMGMMMLPPTTISMPFKVLLFVLADGWNLVIVGLVRTFL